MPVRQLLGLTSGLLLLALIAGVARGPAQQPAALSGSGGHVSAPLIPTPVPTSEVPFAGRLLAYAFHGFTAPELDRIRRAVPGTLAVSVGEVAVASGKTAYPVVPVEAMTAPAGDYATAAGRPSLAAALAKGAVLAKTEAMLRHLRVGQPLVLADGSRIPVTAVVDDAVVGGNEMALPASYVPVRKGSAASYVLLPGTSGTAAAVQKAMRGRDVRVRARTDNGFLSADDTVLTQLQVKARFGEFALRPRDDGSGFDQDPAFERDRLVYVPQVQQLGPIKCNRALIAPLRAAMKEITDRGLGSTIDTADFQYEGGCWNPSVVPLSGGSISRHSWGIAVDINVATNDLGGKPRQDARLVAIMRKHGFVWGGEFLRPDGMHFEYVGSSG